MSETGERAQSIIANIRERVGPELRGEVDELDGLVRELDLASGGIPNTTGSGFTQARSVESDPEGKHTPGPPG